MQSDQYLLHKDFEHIFPSILLARKFIEENTKSCLDKSKQRNKRNNISTFHFYLQLIPILSEGVRVNLFSREIYI